MIAEPDDQVDSVGEAIVQVADDAKSYAAAQLALYKAIANARWRFAQTGLILGSLALVLALAAIIALVVGMLLSLVPSVGPLAATAITVVVVLVIAGALGWAASRRFAAAFGAIE